MAFKLPSRVLETTISTGTGALTLAGAVNAEHRAFADVLSNADTTFYFIKGGGDFEIGYGTYSGGALTRTTVLKSSNANAAVNWPSGAKLVGIAPLGPSDLDSTNLARLQGALGLAIGSDVMAYNALTGKRLKRVTEITSSQTYTVPAGVTALLFRAVAGGGGGGGASTDGSTTYGCAGGGGSGEFGQYWVSSPAASYAITIGAAGAAGASGAGDGGSGGNTVIGSLATLTGGGGGSGRSGLAGSSAALGGVGGGVSGQPGQPGITSTGTGTGRHAGTGGSSIWGGGGRAIAGTTTTGSEAGSDAAGYGGGGSGAYCGTSGGNRAGGAGTPGRVEIWEFVDW